MKKLITILFLFVCVNSFAQNVGIGTTTPDANAQLDVSSTNKGILIPRMTLAQRNAIPGITLGLLIYQTDNNPGFYVNKSSVLTTNWVPITEGKNLWSVSLGNSDNILPTLPGNVGIGTSLAGAKLNVADDVSDIAIFENTTALNTNVNAGIYLKTGTLLNTFYTGSLKSIGTSTNTARLGLFGGVATTSNALVERISILNNGSIGIGTTTPSYPLDINGRARIRYNGTTNTAGIWYNKSDNTESAFVGMLNDTVYGQYGNGTWRIASDIKNGMLGIGNLEPKAPLSFASTIGNKIALWGDATGGHYGLGIQGSLLQMYSSGSNADIAFGYGSSNAFTENARLLGGGNIHLGKYNTWVSAADNRKINFGDGDYVFVGEQDADDRLTLRAGEFDFRGGDVFIGPSDFVKGAGYKLRVNGKIISEEVRVQLNSTWPDYVFNEDYKTLTIPQLEEYVKQNKHLPNVPSAKDIENNGHLLGEIQIKLLEKIEEMSLYIIEANKKIEVLTLRLNKIEKTSN